MFSKLALLSLASLVLADSESFGLVVIRSGTRYQNAGVKVADGALSAGAGSDFFEGTILDDGRLKTSNGKYVSVTSNGMVVGDASSAPFAIADGRLSYEGQQGFAIDDGTGKVSAGGSYVLAPFLKSGSRASDFTPHSASSGKASSASSSDGFIVQTANGANALTGVGFGAAVVAGAALLI